MTSEDIDDIEDTIRGHRRLVEKAIDIISASPYNIHIDEPQFVSLEIKASKVVVKWPRHLGDYPGLDRQEQSFPVVLLALSDQELSDWRERGVFPPSQSHEA